MKLETQSSLTGMVSNESIELCAFYREKELKRLVRLVSDHEGFTETEHKEELEGALSDPVNALACFSSLVRRIESLKPCNSGENGTTS